MNHKVLSLYYETYYSTGDNSYDDNLKCTLMSIQNLRFEMTYWKYLYYVMIHLYKEKKFDDLESLITIINGYDLCKLTQRKEIELLDFILKRIPKSRMIPAAMGDPSTVKVFLDNGWDLDDDILIQYYETPAHLSYKYSLIYYLSQRSITNSEVLQRFKELCDQRHDVDIAHLVKK